MQRIVLKYTEERKKQLVELAKYSKDTKVIGEYYIGCKLVKHVYPGQTILAIS